jgi:hypothetical protein
MKRSFKERLMVALVGYVAALVLERWRRNRKTHWLDRVVERLWTTLHGTAPERNRT